MTDYLVHGLAVDDQVRAVCARTTHMAEEARWRHDLWPIPAAALGRTMTGAALMAAALKHDQKIQVQVVGDGPIRYVTASADSQGGVRGYVGEPHVHLPSTQPGKLAVGQAVGSGKLHVIRDLGMREPYTSTLPLVSGEIAEDLTHYLVASEQTPSVLSLGVLVETDHSVRASGGFMLQLLPGADEQLGRQLEERLRDLPGISRQVDEGRAPEQIVEDLFQGWGDVRWLERRSVSFHCPCSWERFEKGLIALGEGEVRDMIDTVGEAELICHFCRERYVFDEEALRGILKEIKRDIH